MKKIRSLTGIVICLGCGVVGGQTFAAAAGTVIPWGGGWSVVPTDLTNIIAVVPYMALRSDGTVTAWREDLSYQTAPPSDLSNVVAIAEGYAHRLALKGDGTVVGWGAGTNNTGIFPDEGQAQIPAGLNNVVSIAAGMMFSVALRSDGRVVAWGRNTNGQTNVPPSLTNAVAISASDDYTLALTANGTVVAWGFSYYTVSNVPAGLSNVISISAGSFHALALKNDGTVVAWGSGDGGATNVPAGLTNVIAIEAGEFYSLALRADHTVRSWGDLQFTIPDNPDIPLGLTNVFALGTGGGFYVLNDGSPAILVPPTNAFAYTGTFFQFSVAAVGAPPLTYQWRFNGMDIPGANNSWLSFNFVNLTNAGDYSVRITNPAGSILSPTATLTTSNSAPFFVVQPVSQTVTRGWQQIMFTVFGRGSSPAYVQWQLNGTNIPGATSPFLFLFDVQYTNAGNYAAILTNAFGAAISSNATLTVLPVTVPAWGINSSSQLNVPALLTNLLAISAGGNFGLALKTDGTVAAWGVGGAYTSPTNVPVGLSNAVSISAGISHGLALRKNGTVVAWGPNYHEQTTVPPNLSNVVAISAGLSRSLALKSDGKVVTWGGSPPIAVPANLSNVVAIACGGLQNLALQSDGRVVIWGTELAGQTNVASGLTNVQAIASGLTQSLALKNDGSLVYWGTSMPPGDYVPPPTDLSNVIAIAQGTSQNLALKSDGTVAAWGWNGYGRTNLPPNLTNVVAISVGDRFSLALLGDAPPAVHESLIKPERNGVQFSVRIPTRSGRVYRLEFKSSLLDSNWTPLPLVAGNGGMLILTDPAASNSQRYYRVRQW